MGNTESTSALVLAGAVARGAFEAGAIGELARRKYVFHRVVGASAGALNAVLIGAGLASGRPARAAELLARLWRKRANWSEFAILSRKALGGQGLCGSEGVERLVRESLEELVGSSGGKEAAPVEDLKITLVTARLHAEQDAAGTTSALYEAPVHFEARELLDREWWPRIACAAAASASFPFLFVPTDYENVPRIDGGAVNNAPISYALDDPSVRELIVVHTQPRKLVTEPPRGPFNYLGQLVEILINERIVRDMGAAKSRNDTLDRLEKAMEAEGLTEKQRAAITQALRWRRLQVVPVQPEEPLDGTAFSGFHDQALRETYLELGQKAAAKALG
jgi:NTE family protein